MRGDSGCRAAAALLIALTVSARARADDRVTFVWDAPPACPSSSAVEDKIVARLGAARAASRVDVRGVVRREADSYRVRVAMGPHERTLLAPSCAQAAEAVAVIVALAIEEADRARNGPAPAPGAAGAPASTPAAANAPATGAATAPATGTARAPTTATAPTAATPPTTPPTTRTAAPTPTARAATSPPYARHVELGVGAAVDTASLPKPSPGVALSMEWRAARWLSLGLTFAAFLPQTERSTGEPSARATVLLADALATACVLAPVALGSRDLDLGACLGAGAGLLPGESAGISNPSSGLGTRPELWAAGRLRLPLSRHIALRLDAGPLVDPVRPTFEVRGVGALHRPAIATLRAVLGLGFTFL